MYFKAMEKIFNTYGWDSTEFTSENIPKGKKKKFPIFSLCNTAAAPSYLHQIIPPCRLPHSANAFAFALVLCNQLAVLGQMLSCTVLQFTSMTDVSGMRYISPAADFQIQNRMYTRSLPHTRERKSFLGGCALCSISSTMGIRRSRDLLIKSWFLGPFSLCHVCGRHLSQTVKYLKCVGILSDIRKHTNILMC